MFIITSTSFVDLSDFEKILLGYILPKKDNTELEFNLYNKIDDMVNLNQNCS